MGWKFPNYKTYSQTNYSISTKLKLEGKTTDEFEYMVSNLSLEDLIGLKLEISTRILGHRVYNFPIWKQMDFLVKDAVLKYALFATRTKYEAASFLGLTPLDLGKKMREYELEEYFIRVKDDEENSDI